MTKRSGEENKVGETVFFFFDFRLLLCDKGILNAMMRKNHVTNGTIHFARFKGKNFETHFVNFYKQCFILKVSYFLRQKNHLRKSFDLAKLCGIFINVAWNTE